jgi:hypothetical protein
LSGWSQYPRPANPLIAQLLTPFIREQELMRELIAKSLLPSLTLDISDNDIPGAVDQGADWLEQSDGLYMRTDR